MATITIGGLQDDDRLDDDNNFSPQPAEQTAYGYPSTSSQQLNNSFEKMNMSAGSYNSSLAEDSPPKPKPRWGGGDQCPRCKKTVYFAEAREGPNNIKYHKSCFSCSTCRKTLDSSFTERQGEIYCKGCYAKDFGPKTFGYGAGSTTEGTPSPQLQPTNSWRSSLSPPSMNRTPGSTGTPSANRTPGSTGTTPSPSRFGGGEKCPRCGKTVYVAEAREGPNNIKYHRSCFTCLTCAKTLDSHFAERQGELYCKPCYGRLFGPSGFGHPGATVR